MALLVALVALAAACGATLAADGQELGSPLRVAQCRAQCLERFANGADMEAMCLQGPDCFMCWENCELLQSNFPVWGAMCSEKGICFPGCQQACRFHREAAARLVQQAQPVIHTRGEEVVRAAAGWARWPRPPTARPAAPLVYVVMRRQPGGSSSWRQLTQTVELSARLPEDSSDPGPATIRVLVVDPEGLVTIYSPVSAASPASGGGGAQFPGGRSASKVLEGHRKKINTEVTPSTGRPLLQADGGPASWELREVSLIHQKVLVIAEIAWRPRVARGVYLVTWEVDGGGLKGNLFTDSTCVTLSLWPDTIYHIQAELVSRSADHRPERSEPMVIDTHRAPRPQQQGPWSAVLAGRGGAGAAGAAGDARRAQLLLAAAGSGLLLALGGICALLWRRRRLQSARPVRLSDHGFFAGLQPIMTVKDSLGKAVSGPAFGSLFAAKGFGRVTSDAAATNPLLSCPSAPSSPEDPPHHRASGFLQAAERGARNEVQV